jgi:DnaJ-class molecular chaperone
VAVELPAGLSAGALVSVPGHGHAGRRGGPPGDLRLTVTVEPHAFFRREGDDVFVDVPVAIHEAALGARIDVPSPGGPVRLRIPPGTAAGQSFRLSERGALSPRTGKRGDLVVNLQVVLPKVIDERSKELLRQFGELNTENVRAGLGV